MAENSFGCQERSTVQTDQIYDSCRSKECMENMRVYFTEGAQETINTATEVRSRTSEIIYVYANVSPMNFNRGYYTVDLTFYFRILMDAYIGTSRPIPVEGLAVFEKKVVLYGSVGGAKIFSSRASLFDPAAWQQTAMPEATVEALDPITLALKLTDENDCAATFSDGDIDILSIPDNVRRVFDDRFIPAPKQGRRVYVTLGLFSIVRLQRSTQLLIPTYDFSIPENECVYSTDEDPCSLFESVNFPLDEFFPPVLETQKEIVEE